MKLHEPRVRMPNKDKVVLKGSNNNVKKKIVVVLILYTVKHCYE